MSTTPQKRALNNYRKRLNQRGMARFEVLGLDADRELIRSLAKRLAGDDPGFGADSRHCSPHHFGGAVEEGRHSQRITPVASGWRRSGSEAPADAGPQGRPVSRSLLDTNIISNVTKPAPSEALVAWMAEQADEDLFISSLTVAEIRRGILEKPAGKKRRELERWFSGPEGPQALFAGRVLPFDEKAGLVWARLMADGTAKGRPRSPLDMIIAAIAEANDCVVVTENERDFAGLEIVNPLR